MPGHLLRVAERRFAEAAAQAAQLPRVFVAGAGQVQVIQASQAASDAYDLMIADGVPPQQAADLAVGADRDSRDPVAWARHFVSLRRSLRGRE